MTSTLNGIKNSWILQKISKLEDMAIKTKMKQEKGQFISKLCDIA